MDSYKIQCSVGSLICHATNDGCRSGCPPHLIVILVDDLGWHNVGWHNPLRVTEHRRAASSGAILEPPHAALSPSRSSLCRCLPIHAMRRTAIDTSKGGMTRRRCPQSYRPAMTATHGKWHLGRASGPTSRATEALTTTGAFDGWRGHYTQLAYEAVVGACQSPSICGAEAPRTGNGFTRPPLRR